MSDVIRFDQVHYTYPGSETPALDNLNLALPKGKRIAILGHNGSGKSTLFLHANGILRPTSGHVTFNDQPLSYRHKNLTALRQQVGVVFQQADDQLFSASVRQDISFGPLNLGLTEAESRARVNEAAAQCRLTHLLDRPTHALSGGEKARAALAGVLAMEPDVLLIDEPTASLDPPARQQIFAIFDALTKQDKTIILATHEIEIAHYWADYVVILEAGKALIAGPAETVMVNQSLLAEAGLDRLWYHQMREQKS